METKEIEIKYQGKALRGYTDLPDGFSYDGKKIPIVIQFHGMCGQCDSKIDLVLANYFTSQRMGAVAATMLAGKYADEIKSMIVLAPAFVIETLCQTGQFGDFSYDPACPPESVEIPGTRFIFSKEYLITGKEINIMSWAAKYKGPVCIIHGDSDDFLPVEIIAPYVEGFERGEMKIVKGGSHFFGGKKAEMVACVDEFLKER